MITHIFKKDQFSFNMSHLKKNDANVITQYRPISLINYSIKIITKSLTKRLAPLIDSLIAHTHTAYIKGKYVLDNIVCAHETIYTIKKIN
jgi:hypothetical protein